MSTIDDARYRSLLDWLELNEVETAGLPEGYWNLRNEALAHGLIQFHPLTERDSEPFAFGTEFHGESIEAVVDEMIANAHKP